MNSVWMMKHLCTHTPHTPSLAMLASHWGVAGFKAFHPTVFSFPQLLPIHASSCISSLTFSTTHCTVVATVGCLYTQPNIFFSHLLLSHPVCRPNLSVYLDADHVAHVCLPAGNQGNGPDIKQACRIYIRSSLTEKDSAKNTGRE